MVLFICISLLVIFVILNVIIISGLVFSTVVLFECPSAIFEAVFGIFFCLAVLAFEGSLIFDEIKETLKNKKIKKNYDKYQLLEKHKILDSLEKELWQLERSEELKRDRIDYILNEKKYSSEEHQKEFDEERKEIVAKIEEDNEKKKSLESDIKIEKKKLLDLIATINDEETRQYAIHQFSLN